jgi:hypothetical protein
VLHAPTKGFGVWRSRNCNLARSRSGWRTQLLNCARAMVQTASPILPGLPTFDGSATKLRVFNRFNPGLGSIYGPRTCPAGATGLSPRMWTTALSEQNHPKPYLRAILVSPRVFVAKPSSSGFRNARYSYCKGHSHTVLLRAVKGFGEI